MKRVFIIMSRRLLARLVVRSPENDGIDFGNAKLPLRRGETARQESRPPGSASLMCAIGMSLCVWNAVVALAAPPGRERFAVDLLTLKSDDRYRGAVLSEANGTMVLAVQRDWLKQSHPKEFADLSAKDDEQRRAVLTRLNERLQAWLAENPEPPTLVGYLESERDRIQKKLKRLDVPVVKEAAATPDRQFLVLRIPASRVEAKFLQGAANRQVAVVSWREQLKDVEKREARDLVAELRTLGIDPTKEVVDLSERLPLHELDDRQWAARRALVEFQFGGRIEFQGTGKALFRTGQGAGQVDLAQVLAGTLQDQLQGQLAELLNEANGVRRPAAKKSVDLKPAIDAAEKENARGFRVTVLQMDVPQSRVTVEQQFVAKMPDGQWQSVWTQSITRDGSQVRKEEEAQIRNDPQVAETLKLFESLGGGADAQLGTAIRFGAATMQAQQEADHQFSLFRDRSLKLDVPSGW